MGLARAKDRSAPARKEAADGGRTRDLKLGKLALYQLSYRRNRPRVYAAALLLFVVRRRLLPIIASLAGVCLIALLLYGVSVQSAHRTLDELVARRQYPLAPDASTPLPVLGASARRALASLKGKVVVLNFWASWCEPCQLEAPMLEHAQHSLARHNATVLGVTFQDASPDSEGFVSRYHLTYPNVRDTTGDFAHSYGTRQVPESFVINRQGRIVAISRGQIEQSFVNEALALAERT
jgi:cytochrome c biogenesis protein CcmG, thiol:disulfide interchange protein DsbE